MTKRAQFFERVHEVTEFCVWNGSRERSPHQCFGGWKRETVFLYVAWHALAGSLFVTRNAERGTRNIEAVGIAWACREQDVEKDFEWRREEPGPVLKVMEVIGTRETAAALLRRALKQWPQVTKFCAFRRGRWVEVDGIGRFAGL